MIEHGDDDGDDDGDGVSIGMRNTTIEFVFVSINDE